VVGGAAGGTEAGLVLGCCRVESQADVSCSFSGGGTGKGADETIGVNGEDAAANNPLTLLAATHFPSGPLRTNESGVTAPLPARAFSMAGANGPSTSPLSV
jgi:hypothetical protein